MKFLKHALVVFAVLGLTACGGGGSSSGGGAERNGVYNGIQNLTYTFPDGTSDNESAAAIFTISGNNITVSDGARSETSTFSGNSFNAPLKFKTSQDGISCNWSLVYRGKIDGLLITGTVSGQVTCSRGSQSAVTQITGPFQARKTTTGKQLEAAYLSQPQIAW